MSRDIPIIFSAAMVNALLAGRKTMTRRLAWKPFRGSMIECKHGFDTCPECDKPNPSSWQRVELGDRLWVREGWKPHSLYAAMKPREMPKTKVFYLADTGYLPSNTPGKPSIHMPRWASRLTLIVTATKTECLRDISEADAKAEGMVFVDHGLRADGHPTEGWHHKADQAALGSNFCLASARDAFANLWASLHGIDSWDANPEVVALTVKPIRANIDAPETKAAAA
jgi:hypothetical protein